MSRLIFLLLALLPGIAFTANKRLLKSKIPLAVLFSATCLVEYGLIQVSVKYRRIELQEAVDRFDLDHNDILTGSEITPESRIAVNQASSDTGLNFAPITGVPYAILWTVLNFTVSGYLLCRIKPKTQRSAVTQF